MAKSKMKTKKAKPAYTLLEVVVTNEDGTLEVRADVDSLAGVNQLLTDLSALSRRMEAEDARRVGPSGGDDRADQPQPA